MINKTNTKYIVILVANQLKKEAEICIACGVRNKHAESHNKILFY